MDSCVRVVEIVQLPVMLLIRHLLKRVNFRNMTGRIMKNGHSVVPCVIRYLFNGVISRNIRRYIVESGDSFVMLVIRHSSLRVVW
jgi:hypothetical protein